MANTKSVDLEEVKKELITKSYLVDAFRRLGICEGMTLLVHSSLSSLGWVCGGAVSVILALEEVLGEEGTLVMPTHCYDLTDPSHWTNPSVPSEWIPIIKKEMPLYDKDLTPTTSMGVIPETFRKQKGVVRSSHPIASFCAWGKHKEYITQDSKFDYSQDEKSPLGRIYELGGWILLLGVGYEKNTSLHLAEYKATYAGKMDVSDGFPFIKEGKRGWFSTRDILYNSDDFKAIGVAYEETENIHKMYIGKALSRLIEQKGLVDFSVRWMEKNRRA